MPILIFLAVSYTGVLAAVAADLLTGILRARRTGTPLTSRGYRRTVDKIRSYLGAMLGLTLVDAVIIAALAAHRACGGSAGAVPFPYLTSAGAVGLCLIEVKSMMENSERRLDFKRAAELAKRLFSLLRG
ncbi:MAG: phage holin family protein [Duncaniella sp.]|nr:phage holin family protein [Duncaniella sp.]MDE6178218.1 phage holin family protein [Duncaniella sp.]MDE6390933.1 phage holin family protein [Duncaniella sp.]